MRAISFNKAKKLSILKWKFIHEKGLCYMEFVRNRGEFLKTYSLQGTYLGSELCGLCERYIMSEPYQGCGHCPLHDDYKNCCKEYEKWINAKQPRWLKYWSGKLLKRLDNLKVIR